MEKPVPLESASAQIDARIKQLADWRGKMLAHVRALIHAAYPEIVEEWKWRGTPVWSHSGIVCTGETYKNVVKLTFAKGAALPDPSGLFNASLEGNVRRALDLHEHDTLDQMAFQSLIRRRRHAQSSVQEQAQDTTTEQQTSRLAFLQLTFRPFVPG